MKPIRYAVTGLNHGRDHVQYALQTPGVELAAICDIDPRHLAVTSELTPETPAFDSFEALLEWGKFDAAIIATPPTSHRKLGIGALEAGKHVFMEKPLAATLADSRALREAAAQADTVFQVGYCVRSSPLIRRLLGHIESGALGNIVSVWFNMFLVYDNQEQEWRNSRDKRGGKLLDCMPHYFDIMQLLAGAPFERLITYGHAAGRTGTNADSIPAVASVMLEYANGAKGTHLLSEVTPVVGNSSYFGVAGTRGIVFGNPWDPDGAGSLECQLEDGLYLDAIRINGSLASRGHLGFKEQHAAFLQAIRTGSGNPCTADDALEVDIMMAAIDRSLTTGDCVKRAEMAG